MYNENFCIRRIKELMKRNGYNTYHLSKQSGVSLSTLSSMFEKNTANTERLKTMWIMWITPSRLYVHIG